MNLFLGVPIPADVIQILVNMLIFEHPHWQNHADIRWTADQNQHLTLHFFGALDPRVLSNLTAGLENHLKDIRNFSIKINKLYNFPKANSNLIAAYLELSNPLALLYSRLQRAVSEFGFNPESRPYLPHVTLCRSRRQGVLRMEPMITPEYPVIVSHLNLYQTHAVKTGNEYRVLQQWPLES